MTEKKEFANRLNTGCQRKTGVQDYMKNLARTTRRAKVTFAEMYPWAEKIPWRRAWQSTPVFLPGESHGQRSLVGYGP